MKKNNVGFTPPKTRKEMEKNIGALIEDTQFKLESENRLVIQSAMIFTVPELNKLKFTPNYRIELMSFNEQIRLQANIGLATKKWTIS